MERSDTVAFSTPYLLFLLLHPSMSLGGDPTGYLDLYLGHGHAREALVWGRVLEGRPDLPADTGRLSRLARNLKRFDTDEVGGVTLEVSFDGVVARGVSDDEGLFQVRLESPAGEPFPAGVRPARVEMVSGPEGLRIGTTTAPVRIFGDRRRVGLVSDVDDTIVVSHVTSKRRLLARTFLRDATQMEPVEGMADLYRALARPDGPPGVTGRRRRADPGPFPVFYVSGSPINLHDRIRSYLEYHRFPLGPIYLKNLGLRSVLPAGLGNRLPERVASRADSLFDQDRYKLETIRQILERYAWLDLYLFGDSGENDPTIYARLADHPDLGPRVRGIFIRHVPGTARLDHPRVTYFTHTSELTRLLGDAGAGPVVEPPPGELPR